MSSAIDAAVVGAVTNNPMLARDMVQTSTVGAILGAQDAARQSTPMPAMAASAAQAPSTYSSASPSYAAALADTSVQAQESLMTLASQNQVLESLMRSL